MSVKLWRCFINDDDGVRPTGKQFATAYSHIQADLSHLSEVFELDTEAGACSVLAFRCRLLLGAVVIVWDIAGCRER